MMTVGSDERSLVVKIAASYLRRNSLSVDQIAVLIASVGNALEQAKIGGTAAEEAALKPAVSIKKSVQREYIVCLEDGRHSRALKRHLRNAHGMTPQQYREKWRLPHDYPMSAPAYSEQRSTMAKAAGLGQPGVTRRTKTKSRPKDALRTDAPVAAL
jgi:predicted transcriptional regulator